MFAENIAYLIAASMFIFGLKDLSHPRRAVRGNLLAAAGMAIAIVFTFIQVRSALPVVIGVVIGSALGAWLAIQVRMTAMPQMVALLNGFGGLASLLVAGLELGKAQAAADNATLVAVVATGIIGAVTFSGSMVAYGKLEEWKALEKGLRLEGHQLISAGVAAVLLLLGAVIVATQSNLAYWLLSIVALGLGVLLTMPIGGADMPVVIALLNSYSGLAAAAAGFVIYNNVLIISGSLVGASGIILCQIMCKAMNRSLLNVLFGRFEPASGGPGDEIYATVRATSAEDVAMILETAQRVVFVPGYGMAVAQAQHAVRDLALQLMARGIEVEYAIHPVAGRMPGHMNVLLAEADVPYEKLKEMDAINPTMQTVDVAIVIGANDVVNPLARTDSTSPIYGMPIIDVDKARTVVVIKRSLSPGFAKIPNPLFAAPNTLMCFGDGREALMEITAALKHG